MFSKLLLIIAVAAPVATAWADQTTEQKVTENLHDAKRSLKKGAHRAEESVCAKGDTQCLGQKGKHRIQESGDYVKDKAAEIKDSK